MIYLLDLKGDYNNYKFKRHLYRSEKVCLKENEIKNFTLVNNKEFKLFYHFNVPVLNVLSFLYKYIYIYVIHFCKKINKYLVLN